MNANERQDGWYCVKWHESGNGAGLPLPGPWEIAEWIPILERWRDKIGVTDRMPMVIGPRIPSPDEPVQPILDGVFDHKPGCKAPDYGPCSCVQPDSPLLEQAHAAARRLLATEAEVLAMPSRERDWFMDKPGHQDAFDLARFALSLHKPAPPDSPQTAQSSVFDPEFQERNSKCVASMPDYVKGSPINRRDPTTAQSQPDGHAGRCVIRKPFMCSLCHCSQTLPADLQTCECPCHPRDLAGGDQSELVRELVEALKAVLSDTLAPVNTLAMQQARAALAKANRYLKEGL